MHKSFIIFFVLTFSVNSQELNNYIRVNEPGKIISGACLFGISYATAAFVSVGLSSSPHEMDQRVSKVLWIPLIGPILADIRDGMEEPAFTVVCTAWSLSEILGAILLTKGIIGKKELVIEELNLKIEPGLQLGRNAGISIKVTY